MASTKLNIEDSYQLWKSGMKIADICDRQDCSRATFNKWRNKPIISPDGVKYANWYERYQAESKMDQEVFEAEIDALMTNGHKLIEVARDKYLMKFIKSMDSDKFKPNAADAVKLVEAAEKMLARLNKVDVAEDTNLNVTLTFADNEELAGVE